MPYSRYNPRWTPEELSNLQALRTTHTIAECAAHYALNYWTLRDVCNRHNIRGFNSLARRKSADPLTSTIRAMLTRARTGAKQKGHTYTITPDDLRPFPTHCPILGTPLEYRGKHEQGRATYSKNRATVDRIDNTRDYVPGNVHIISNHANTLKSRCSLEEMCKLGPQLAKWARIQLDNKSDIVHTPNIVTPLH